MTSRMMDPSTKDKRHILLPIEQHSHRTHLPYSGTYVLEDRVMRHRPRLSSRELPEPRKVPAVVRAVRQLTVQKSTDAAFLPVPYTYINPRQSPTLTVVWSQSR